MRKGYCVEVLGRCCQLVSLQLIQQMNVTRLSMACCGTSDQILAAPQELNSTPSIIIAFKTCLMSSQNLDG